MTLSAGEQHGRHVDPLRLGRLEVDDQFKFRRLRNRNVLRLFALENVSDWDGEAAKYDPQDRLRKSSVRRYRRIREWDTSRAVAVPQPI